MKGALGLIDAIKPAMIGDTISIKSSKPEIRPSRIPLYFVGILENKMLL